MTAEMWKFRVAELVDMAHSLYPDTDWNSVRIDIAPSEGVDLMTLTAKRKENV